jgi:hypothetical protein
MRCVAGAGLLVLVGCNQVFGLHKNEPYDATQTVKLVWQVATVKPSGAPDTPALAAISPAPAVRYAPLDGAWKDAVYGADGSIAVDAALFEPTDAGPPTWRLEYTLADGVVHEVQWAPESARGQIAIPRFAPLDRAPLPAGAGYALAPTPPPASYTDPRVLTSGVWSEGKAVPGSAPQDATKATYDFASAVWLGGEAAAPDAGKGDQAFLLDFVTDADRCRHAVGSTPITPASVQPGHSTPATAWETAETQTVTLAAVAFSGPEVTRLGDRIIGPLGGSDLLGLFTLGYAASAAMPGAPALPRAAQPADAVLPMPVMLTVMQCRYDHQLPVDAYTNKVAAQPPKLAAFSRLLNVQLYSTRTLDSDRISLSSGMSSAVLADGFANLAPRFLAAIPAAVRLEAPGKALDLIEDPDGVAFGPPARATLTITPEATPGTRADYYDVILHRIAGGQLTTERVYTITSPVLVIEAAALTSGDYVLEIRSYAGHPDVSHGDFAPVSYPYGSTVFFTRKLHVG